MGPYVFTFQSNYDTSDTTYHLDSRTGLCFAVIGLAKGGNFIGNSTSMGMSWVPCTDDVLALVPRAEAAATPDERIVRR